MQEHTAFFPLAFTPAAGLLNVIADIRGRSLPAVTVPHGDPLMKESHRHKEV